MPALVELAELLAIGVLESAAFCVNFPGDHPLHAGYQFTTSAQNQVLAAADVILSVQQVSALQDRLKDQIGTVTGRLDAMDTERQQLLTQ